MFDRSLACVVVFSNFGFSFVFLCWLVFRSFFFIYTCQQTRIVAFKVGYKLIMTTVIKNERVTFLQKINPYKSRLTSFGFVQKSSIDRYRLDNELTDHRKFPALLDSIQRVCIKSSSVHLILLLLPVEIQSQSILTKVLPN